MSSQFTSKESGKYTRDERSTTFLKLKRPVLEDARESHFGVLAFQELAFHH